MNTKTSKIIFIAYSTLLWTGSFVRIVAEAPVAQFLTTEEAIIQTAVQSFKEMLATKDGHPNRLSCTVKMNNGKAVETITKMYYSNYHQKPACVIVRHSNETPTQKCEVIFSKNNTSSFIVKENGTKKQVPVPVGFSI